MAPPLPLHTVIAFKRVDEARRKRRIVSDLNSPVKAKSKAGAEPVYQNVEGKTENGPPPIANNEPENRATYENMPFHPQRNSKGCPSTASTVTSESTVTTSASDAPSLGSCKGLKPTSSSTATPPPCQRDERRQPTHYVNVMAPARAFPDPVHASINGVGLPPPRPKSTKPGSHVSTPVGSLGRRSATPMRTESRNGYRNGADGVPAHGAAAGYGLPSSRAHSPMMMQQQYHHYPRAALRDEDASDGGDLPLSSTPKPYRPDINDELLYADMYEDVKAGRVPDPRLVKPPTAPPREAPALRRRSPKCRPRPARRQAAAAPSQATEQLLLPAPTVPPSRKSSLKPQQDSTAVRPRVSRLTSLRISRWVCDGT
ncbi:hypothetical protein MTO96_017838 [Rhipicephalus appendiculatus]